MKDDYDSYFLIIGPTPLNPKDYNIFPPNCVFPLILHPLGIGTSSLGQSLEPKPQTLNLKPQTLIRTSLSTYCTTGFGTCKLKAAYRIVGARSGFRDLGV